LVPNKPGYVYSKRVHSVRRIHQSLGPRQASLPPVERRTRPDLCTTFNLPFVSPVLALLRLSDFSLDRPFRLSLHVVGIPPCLALLGWGTTRREKRCPLISLRNFIPPIRLKIGMEVEKGISRRVVVVSGQNSSSLSRKLRNTTPESRFLPISNYKTYPLDSQLAQNRLRGILEYVLGLGGCRGGPSTPRGLEG
jgi:hypothetical protein